MAPRWTRLEHEHSVRPRSGDFDVIFRCAAAAEGDQREGSSAKAHGRHSNAMSSPARVADGTGIGADCPELQWRPVDTPTMHAPEPIWRQRQLRWPACQRANGSAKRTHDNTKARDRRSERSRRRKRRKTVHAGRRVQQHVV